ncbi:hypothetical protein SLEP1_g44493 [Rubroshorea leprosula]|uniref:Uncharacterized protein n=1 Tax=Rubroshorea leprosula TaxID=152421 RepID=A0AAV5LHQ0_9ROSI|nr:hypothetical protein SLEP1_g44493 [Rubroshorea leprosula]
MLKGVGSLVLCCVVYMVMEEWPNLPGGGNFNGKGGRACQVSIIFLD